MQRAHHNARVSAETCATSTQQSIASAHGAEILCSFLHKTHAFHGSPVSFPNLSKGVIKLSPVYYGLDQDEVPESSPQAHEGAEDYAMLESTAETFASTGTRTVDSEEMFIGLIDRINSPLGQVWLDGVSVSTFSLLGPVVSRLIYAFRLEHRRRRPSLSLLSSSPMQY